VVRMEKRNAYRVLVWKPVGKRPLGRPSRRWEDSIKVAIKGTGLIWLTRRTKWLAVMNTRNFLAS
jgi:hypothetical protein